MNDKKLPCTKDNQYICRMRDEEGKHFECIYEPGKCYWRKKIEPKQEELLSGGEK